MNSAYADFTHAKNCPVLAKTYDLEKANDCLSQTPIVNEVVGALSPVELLPGCNALWIGNGSKPACPPGRIDGGEMDLVQPTIRSNGDGYVG